jgi:cysteine desulfurase
LFSQLQRDAGDELIVHGRLAQRLPNTLCVSFPLVSAQDLLARAAEICASTGAAWHSSTAAISPTLAAMGVSPEHARGTVRFSVGWYTTEDEIDRAASLLASAWEALS